MSSLPTVHGENVVLRVLDKTHSLVPLDQLGISAPNLALIERALERPDGIFIVTGPTGSGKTTTLYAHARSDSSPDVNIVTLEDPVEYQLPLLRQTQVRESTGLGFAEGVRALLRQDPDIVFIGEVRDADTATMAVRAAMTGHQVFTTLHTNDALSAIPRLTRARPRAEHDRRQRDRRAGAAPRAQALPAAAGAGAPPPPRTAGSSAPRPPSRRRSSIRSAAPPAGTPAITAGCR